MLDNSTGVTQGKNCGRHEHVSGGPRTDVEVTA